MTARRQEDFKRQTGRAQRGLVQLVRFIIFGGIAYAITSWLFNSETISYDQIYRMGVSSEIPEPFLFAGLLLGILVAFQLLSFLIYFWIRPGGRHKAGSPFITEADRNRFEEY